MLKLARWARLFLPVSLQKQGVFWCELLPGHQCVWFRGELTHKAWYWNHGLRRQTSLVCRSCDKRHTICSIRLLQYVLCSFFSFSFSSIMLFEVLYRHNCGTSSIFVSQIAAGFWNAIRTDVSLGVFIINTRNLLFHPFVLFHVMFSGSVWFTWHKCGNILPLYCNVVVVWSLEIFFFFS